LTSGGDAITQEHRLHNCFWELLKATVEIRRAFEEGAPEADAKQLQDIQEQLTRIWASVEDDFPPGIAMDIACKVRRLVGTPPTAADELARLASGHWQLAADAAAAARFSDYRARITRADGHHGWANRTSAVADGSRTAATDISHAAEVLTSMLARPACQQTFLIAWIRQDMPEHRRAQLDLTDSTAPRRALEALAVLLAAAIDDDGSLATAVRLLPGFAGDTRSLATATLGVLQQR
jgi:hypothetical protein